MKSLLVADYFFNMPHNGCSSNFSSFANEQITFTDGIALVFTRFNIHGGQVREIDCIPLDIYVSKVWDKVTACNAAGVQHLSKF